MNFKKVVAKVLKNLLFWLIIAIGLGFVIGHFANEGLMMAVVGFRHILNQIIGFIVPLIILAMIAPTIIGVGEKGSKLFFFSISIAFVLYFVIALIGVGIGYAFLPMIGIGEHNPLEQLPRNPLGGLMIPPIMPILSALVLSILLGLSAVWTKSENMAKLLNEFQKMISVVVKRVMLPIIPIWIGATFAQMAYQGTFSNLPAFAGVIALVIISQYALLVLLYLGAFLYTRKNPFQVLRHYGKPYMTAFGCASSSATMGVALEAARKSPVLNKRAIEFGIPFFANVLFYGATLAGVIITMAVSLFYYGSMPSLGSMLLFSLLLGVFFTAAPGIPGGAGVATQALAVAVLGFIAPEAGGVAAALILVMYVLQDNFGTATNITGDGAMMMVLSKRVEKMGLDNEPEDAK